MIIAGNWKMNMTRASAADLTNTLSEYWAKESRHNAMVIFPPAVLIDTVCTQKSGGLEVGGQDCHHAESGAHTGDIAALMLAEAGCGWVLAGHSERRSDHGEDSALVAAKAQAATRAGLKAMICVGETLDERQSGRANDVVEAQVLESLPVGLEVGQFAIAYEPVWAIGTGEVASPQDVAAMHDHIRMTLTGRDKAYDEVDILYGGSVKPDNAESLLKIDNVGGALVGGASLNADDFIAIAVAAG
jgi:triosephosphate isomerase